MEAHFSFETYLSGMRVSTLSVHLLRLNLCVCLYSAAKIMLSPLDFIPYESAYGNL